MEQNHINPLGYVVSCLHFSPWNFHAKCKHRNGELSLHLYLHLLVFASACVLSCFTYVWLFVTLWTVARQAPLSMGFSRQEYWSGLPCPSPVDIPDPRIEPMSPAAPALQANSLLLSHQGSPGARGHSHFIWLPFHPTQLVRLLKQ